jgi:hypothetical protein
MKIKNRITIILVSVILIGGVLLIQSQKIQAAEFVIPEENDNVSKEFEFVNDEAGLMINNPSVTSKNITLDLEKLMVNRERVRGYWCYNLPSDNAGFPYEPYEGWIVASFKIQQADYQTQQAKLSTEQLIKDEKGEPTGKCDYFEVVAPELNSEQPFTLIAEGLRHSYNYNCAEILDLVTKNETEIKISCEENDYMLSIQINDKPIEMSKEDAESRIAQYYNPKIDTEWVFEIMP